MEGRRRAESFKTIEARRQFARRSSLQALVGSWTGCTTQVR